MAQTLFERYGGFPAVRKIVTAFYDRVLESDVVAHHFEHIDMRRLIDHQTKFVSFLMDGPASYSDDHLKRVHERLKITTVEFEEIVSLLSETLEDFDLAADDVAVVEQEMRKRELTIVSVR